MKKEDNKPHKTLLLQKQRHNNDYYTRYNIVEKYIEPYKQYFSGKTVYCPCDDYRRSNFVKYFENNFNELGLKGLIASNKALDDCLAFEYHFDGTNKEIKELEDDGCCLSDARNELYEKCDIIATNPPFSLDIFNPLFEKLMYFHNKYGKDIFLFGSVTSPYKFPFEYLKRKEIYLALLPSTKYPFDCSDGTVMNIGFLLYETFEKPKPRRVPQGTDDIESYVKYDNYDAINVNSFEEVPVNYNGKIGIPPTCIGHAIALDYDVIEDFKNPIINGENKFERIIIQKNIDSYISDKLDLFICTHKNFISPVKNNTYRIVDTTKINNNTWFGLKGSFLSEILAFFYVADNVPLKEYVGFCQYRKYLSFFDNIKDAENAISEHEVVVGKPIEFTETIKEQYAKCHNIEDLYIASGVLAELYPDYVETWNNFLNGKRMFPGNILIMKSSEFKEYARFLYNMLIGYLSVVGLNIEERIENNKNKYIKNINPCNKADYQYRIGGFLGERLTNVWLLKNHSDFLWFNVVVTAERASEQ